MEKAAFTLLSKICWPAERAKLLFSVFPFFPLLVALPLRCVVTPCPQPGRAPPLHSPPRDDEQKEAPSTSWPSLRRPARQRQSRRSGKQLERVSGCSCGIRALRALFLTVVLFRDRDIGVMLSAGGKHYGNRKRFGDFFDASFRVAWALNARAVAAAAPPPRFASLSFRPPVLGHSPASDFSLSLDGLVTIGRVCWRWQNRIAERLAWAER